MTLAFLCWVDITSIGEVVPGWVASAMLSNERNLEGVQLILGAVVDKDLNFHRAPAILSYGGFDRWTLAQLE